MAQVPLDERIRAAEQELAAANRTVESHYPGSPEWEAANARVERWTGLLRELRDEKDAFTP